MKLSEHYKKYYSCKTEKYCCVCTPTIQEEMQENVHKLHAAVDNTSEMEAKQNVH